MRKLIALVIVAIMLGVATGASAQIVLPDPPWCDPCPPVYYLPIVHVSEVQ